MVAKSARGSTRAPSHIASPKPIPLRTCIATGLESTAEHLLRFVAGPSGAPMPDYTAKLPGRGAWLLPTRANYALALKKKAFQRHLETTAEAPAWPTIQAQLHTRAMQALGLAKRAGQLVVGLDGCLEQKHSLKAVIIASDAGTNVQQKFSQRTLPTSQLFTKRQLEEALNIPNCAIVGLLRLDTAWPTVQKATIAQGIDSPHDPIPPPPTA